MKLKLKTLYTFKIKSKILWIEYIHYGLIYCYNGNHFICELNINGLVNDNYNEYIKHNDIIEIQSVGILRKKGKDYLLNKYNKRLIRKKINIFNKIYCFCKNILKIPFIYWKNPCYNITKNDINTLKEKNLLK